MLKLPPEAFEDLGGLASGREALAYLARNLAVLDKTLSLNEAIAALTKREDARGLGLERASRGLAALVALRHQLDFTTTGLLSALSNAIEDSASADWLAEHRAGWQDVQPLLAELLDPNGPIALCEKARILAYSYPNILTDARLLTDIRPVFDTDATSIKRMSVSFVLAIEHYENEQRRTTHFALDYSDLEGLLAQCSRAKVKAKTVLTQLDGCEWTTSVAGMSEEAREAP
jgi:hypothetical protein